MTTFWPDNEFTQPDDAANGPSLWTQGKRIMNSLSPTGVRSCVTRYS
jgi:hypothetical protein